MSKVEEKSRSTPSGDGESDLLYEKLKRFVGQPYSPPTPARDPVNQPMIRHWCDAIGDTNPIYTDEDFAAGTAHGGIVAPPTMLQAWTMRGLVPAQQRHADQSGDADNQRDLMKLLDEAGFSSVVATNCEQDYHRYLRPGDLLSVSSEVEEISRKKKTGLGEGYFITTLQTYKDQNGEAVGEMRFRILKFKPPQRDTSRGSTEPARQPRPQPAVNRDVAFFWEGAERGELLIQRCSSCGALRHPPRPACPSCRSLDWDTISASGKGEVYSYVIHHHPPLPGFEVPFVVALVELQEGVRMVGNVLEVDPQQVEIGMPVEVLFVKTDDGLTIPQWRALK